ncbi:lethal(3)malignant brain tumor-like protein 4 isoform X2 [Symsagittifera roscoffensis]|uniref:lethal(3)malignant brain tumor-like protein 4 isoform X2 n=1 Tax=Symsagittifera roscoffensis TaxID=84072 RepID=UPI00307CA812
MTDDFSDHLALKAADFVEESFSDALTDQAPVSEDKGNVDKKIKTRRIHKKRRGFSWDKYLVTQAARGCPTECFPRCMESVSVSLKFKEGMKLESVDPKNPSSFCIVTVMERKSFRLRMNFDGFAPCYDFICNANSHFLLPVNWCKQHGKRLELPKGYTTSDWNEYGALVGASTLATDDCFQFVPSSEIEPCNYFIEALNKSNEMQPALVKENIGDYILVEFLSVSISPSEQRWFNLSSPCIKPFGWSHDKGFAFNDCQLTKQSKLEPLPNFYFKKAPELKFEKGCKLEAVDQWNQILIRVCTIIDIFHLDGSIARLKLQMDSWSEDFAFWVDSDSEEIYPPNFCSTVGYPLTPPNEFLGPAQGSSCPTQYCRGQGHVKGPRFLTHHNGSGCPYSTSKLQIPDRLTQLHSPNKNSPTSSNSTNSSLSPQIDLETKEKLVTSNSNSKSEIKIHAKVEKDLAIEAEKELLNKEEPISLHDEASSQSFKEESGSITATENQNRPINESERIAELITDESVTKIDTETESSKTITEPEIEQILVKDSPPDEETESLKVENKEASTSNELITESFVKTKTSTVAGVKQTQFIEKPRKPRFCCGGNRADFDQNEDLLERAIYNSVFGLPLEGRYTELGLCSKHKRKLMPTFRSKEPKIQSHAGHLKR